MIYIVAHLPQQATCSSSTIFGHCVWTCLDQGSPAQAARGLPVSKSMNDELLVAEVVRAPYGTLFQVLPSGFEIFTKPLEYNGIYWAVMGYVVHWMYYSPEVDQSQVLRRILWFMKIQGWPWQVWSISLKIRWLSRPLIRVDGGCGIVTVTSYQFEAYIPITSTAGTNSRIQLSSVP